jgi:hypothetical protein
MASDPHHRNLSSDVPHIGPVHESVPQLKEINTELFEDYNGIWKGFRVEF